jgi:hypothetical protein
MLTATNSPALQPAAALVLGGYIEVIVEEFDMQRVEHIGLALEAYDDGAYQFEEEEDAGSDGANPQLVFRTPTGVLDIALPPSVPVAGAITTANPTSPNTAVAVEQMWSEALSYLREGLAAAIWEVNGGYCPVMVNIYEQTYTTLAEGVVSLNSYALSAVVDLSQSPVRLSRAADAAAQTIRDILVKTITTSAFQPLYPGSFNAATALSINKDSASTGEDESDGDGEDGIKIRKLRQADADRAGMDSPDLTLEIYAPLHLPGIKRPSDAVACRDFDRQFYSGLFERFGRKVSLSTNWTNPTGYTVIDGDYPHNFDYDEDEDEGDLEM